MQSLLIDILDTDEQAIIDAYLKHYSIGSNRLDLDALLGDKRVWESVVFGELWKELIGVYPSFPIAKTFLDSSLTPPQIMTRQFDTNRFVAFFTSLIPFWSLHSEDAQAITGRLHVVSTSYNAAYLICLKLSYRYGIFPAIDQLSSLLTGGCFTPNALMATTKMCEIVGVSRPPSIKSSKALHALHAQCIDALNIKGRNPLNGLTRSLDDRITFRTIFDAFAYCFVEPSVVLMIAGAHVFTSPPAATVPHHQCTRLAEHISAALPNNRLLLLSPEAITVAGAPTNMLLYYQPFLLHYAPKLAMTHIQFHTNDHHPVFIPSLTKNVKRRFENLCMELRPDKLWAPVFENEPASPHERIIERLSKVFCKALLSSNAADNNTLCFYQFLMRYFAKHGTDLIASFRPKAGARNAVMLIDSRDNILSVASVLITFFNLSQDFDWSLAIVCNVQNRPFYESFFGEQATRNIDFVTQFHMPMDGYTIDMYNNLLKSASFWESISASYDKVLIIQDDGMIVRKGLERTEFFSRCKYIGAPWCPNRPENKALLSMTHDRMVGNGGLSLRDTQTMLAVCKQHREKNKALHFNNFQQEPEDVFFARYCNSNDVGAFSEAVTFSTEQVLPPANSASFGFHKFWPYHRREDVCRLFNNILGNSYAMDVEAFDLENYKKGER